MGKARLFVPAETRLKQGRRKKKFVSRSVHSVILFLQENRNLSIAQGAWKNSSRNMERQKSKSYAGRAGKHKGKV